MTEEQRLQARSWAEKEDYTAGLRLWAERYGEDVVYRALCRGGNGFNRKKLREGLLAGVDEPAAKSQAALPPKIERPDPEVPPEVVAWKSEAGRLMDERTLLKQRLRELPDPERREDRRLTAGRIQDITDRLDDLFGMIGYWEQFGRVPGPSDNPATDAPKYPREYLNLRTYVSRKTRQLAQTTDQVRRAEMEAQIAAWQARMAEIELEL